MVSGATVPTAAGLVALAVLDGSLSGFRSACGRSALVVRGRLERRVSVGGAVAGWVTVLALACWFGSALAVAHDADASIRSLTSAGTRMLAVYALLAAATLLALVGYLLAPLRWRSLAIVATLGPLSLLRPCALVAGALVAAWGAPLGLVSVSCVVAVVAVTAETMAIDRWVRRVVRTFDPAAPT